MPSYNYPAMYPTSYQPQSYMPQQPQPQPQISQAQMSGMCWVDGEVGAKAQQIPPGWDITKPFPMWDTNDQVIYLKSFNAMGMPNPLTKLHYTIEEQQSRQAPMMSTQAALPSNGASQPDMSEFVKKADLEKMKEELKAAIKEGGAKSAKSSV